MYVLVVGRLCHSKDSNIVELTILWLCNWFYRYTFTSSSLCVVYLDNNTLKVILFRHIIVHVAFT